MIRCPLIVLAGAALAMTSCKPKVVTTTGPTLQSRQSGPWRDNASVILTGSNQIYYYGTATSPAAPAGTPWSGWIAGDIFLVTPNSYMMIPSGTLTVHPDGSVATSGISKSGIIDQPKKP